MIEMEKKPGEEIRAAALRACRLADERDEPVEFTFNGAKLTVQPGEGYPEVVDRYFQANPPNWDH